MYSVAQDFHECNRKQRTAIFLILAYLFSFFGLICPDFTGFACEAQIQIT